MTPSRRADEVSRLVRISAALAAGDESALVRRLETAAEMLDPGGVEEVLLQSYLFLGYPAALNAFALWRRVGPRCREEVSLAVEAEGEGGGPRVPSGDWDSWETRGEEVCRVVYGGQYEGLRKNVRRLHPDMERWMVVEGYGKVLGRPGLDLATRELCIVALLAVLDAPRQLYSHLRGALNAGATVEEVSAAMDEARSVAGDEAHRTAMEVWNQLRARSSSDSRDAGH
jgi:4-carboxymuconolactone decarboxylase